MLGSIYRRVCCSNLGTLMKSENTQLSHMVAKPFSSSSLAPKNDELQRSVMVSYLVNTCGLSPERAVVLANRNGRRLRFDSHSANADSTIAFLRTHGFGDADISRIVSFDPGVLFCAKKTLLRKFGFFYSIGFTKEDLPKFISCQHRFWVWGLDGRILPLYSILKEVLRSQNEIVYVMKRLSFLVRIPLRDFSVNVDLLKENGVPLSKIGYLLRHSPTNLLMDPNEFRRIFDEVKALGFNLSTHRFMSAINALGSRYKTTRKRCSSIYKEYGFSENDVTTAFRKWPQSMLMSEKKLRDTLDFLMNRMGCEVGTIVRIANVLSYDLEGRIIPRCSIMHVLVRKGLIKEWTLNSVVPLSEKCFLKKYIAKYDGIAPELLSVYHRKVDPFKEIYSPAGNGEDTEFSLQSSTKNTYFKWRIQ